MISILAPTRGATFDTPVGLHFQPFQSSLPRGERHLNAIKAISSIYFNPRSHEGSDPFRCLLILLILHFNPRSHEGSDPGQKGKVIFCYISILAPTRGATISDASKNAVTAISILAPTRGATAIFAKKFSSLSAKIV